MNRFSVIIGLSSFLLGSISAWGQTGPFSPEDWPATINKSKTVHFVATDGSLSAPGATWLADELRIQSNGDQVTQPITIGGHDGLKVTGNFLNVADMSFGAWADKDVIDILVQVYGDAAVLNASGQPRNFNFLTGTLPELVSPVGGQIPVEAKNKKWNWVLFRITNGLRPSDGSHYVGSIPANAQGTPTYGGVNGGTIRFEAVPNLIVRVVAFGEEGAFGEPDAINLFFPAETCDPEPNTNLAGIDLNAGQTNHVEVLNDGDQLVTYQDNVGPAGDKRHAVAPMGAFINFAVTDTYLGKACNDPRAVKVCLDIYDDPAFAGADVRFGPEAYATDDKGGTGIFPASQRQVMSGSGQWLRRSWTVPAVGLKGVNAGSLTAGPRFTSENGQVFISRFQMAVLRTGDHPLAGQDPLANCYEDPNICTDAYANYAELDFAQDIKNGLDIGTSTGDQVMVVEEAGPPNDRRQAVRPDNSAGYLNFAITDSIFGPSSQDMARLAICVTYYDDAALAGARFKPEVYMTMRNGTPTFGFRPDSDFVTLEGSGAWRTAYWEIDDMKFSGVNQGPQAAARFQLTDQIFLSRVRYGVIRPCGPKANINPVSDCAPVTSPTLAATLTADKKVRLSWPTSYEGFSVQSTSGLNPPQWVAVNAPPTVEGDQNVVTIKPDATSFYRLAK